MNNKGEFLILSGAIFIIVLTSLGIVTLLTSSKTLYVGDIKTKTFVNYFECEEEAQKIPEENLIFFKSDEEAINEGFNKTECLNIFNETKYNISDCVG